MKTGLQSHKIEREFNSYVCLWQGMWWGVSSTVIGYEITDFLICYYYYYAKWL